MRSPSSSATHTVAPLSVTSCLRRSESALPTRRWALARSQERCGWRCALRWMFRASAGTARVDRSRRKRDLYDTPHASFEHLFCSRIDSLPAALEHEILHVLRVRPSNVGSEAYRRSRRHMPSRLVVISPALLHRPDEERQKTGTPRTKRKRSQQCPLQQTVKKP